MKLLNILAVAASVASAAVIVDVPAATTVEVDQAQITHPPLEKRYQKVRLPKSTTTSSSTEIPKPWRRTIYGSIVEIVTPTVIQGVTFSAKPPAETGGYPKPWVSLNKEGSPKTIKPQVKNGGVETKNASPTYSTYFQTATTRAFSYEELKAHNMDKDSVHEEIEYIDEDKTYVSLNPLLRCTPDDYYDKGLARDKKSAPFCTPHEHKELKLGQVYFITWFTKYFKPEVKNVRLHFTYVKEDLATKGMKKRDVEKAFFTTEWIINRDGYYPFEIQEDWLLDKFIQNIGVSIQPDNVSDEDFDVMENTVIFKIIRGPRIAKKNKETRRIEDEGISDDSAYYIILSIPSVVAVSALGMYFFLWLTRGDRDISAIRSKVWKSQHKVLGKFKPSKKNKRYSELPQFNKDGTKQL